MRSRSPTALVLAAALLGAAAQALAAPRAELASLVAAGALFAAGGWLLRCADRARPEPFDALDAAAATPRDARGRVPIATLLAVSALLGAIGSSTTDVALSAAQVAAWLAACVALVAAAVLRDRAVAPRPPAVRVDLSLALALVALALALRLWRLAEIPPILWEDEIYYLQDAISLLRDELLSPFATGEWGAPYLHAYSIAAAVSLLEDRTVALRLVSVVPGALAVPVLYLGLRELFDRRFALVAAVLQAVAAWSILQSRHGYVWAASTLAVAASVRWLARGLRLGRWTDFALAGFALGIGVLYTYAAAFMPLAVAAFLAGLAATRPRLLRSRAGGCLVMIGGALLVAGPRLATFAAHPESRGYQASAWIWSAGESFPFATIARQWLEIAGAFNHRADAWGQFLPYAYGPLLDPISAAAFGLGLFWALFSWRRPGALLLLLTFVVMLLPSALALAVTERATAWRACGAIPVVFALAGAPFAIAARSAEGAGGRLLVRIVIAALLALATFANLHVYFVWHPRKGQWSNSRSAMLDRAARLVLSAPPGTRVLLAADLEWPYVHALAAGLREYDTIAWPDGSPLPPALESDRPVLVVVRVRNFFEDDVSPGEIVLDRLAHDHPGGSRSELRAGDGSPMLATYALEPDAIRSPELLRRQHPPAWGLIERVRSPRGVEERWVPALWTSDVERLSEIDADAGVEWDGELWVAAPGPQVLLLRTRAAFSFDVDGVRAGQGSGAWPDWQRFSLDLAPGWHALRIRAQAPVTHRDLQAVLIDALRVPAIVGGRLTRPPATPDGAQPGAVGSSGGEP